MFEHLYHLITGNVQNQFLSGGIVLMVLGALAAYARRLPVRAWSFLHRRCIITLDITNEDPVFYWLAAWLSLQPYSRRARNLSVTTMRDHYGSIAGSSNQPVAIGSPEAVQRERRMPEIVLTPAPGHHLFFFERRPIWLVRTRESGNKEGNAPMFSLFNRESFTIRIVARKQETARKLIEEARKMAIVEQKTRTNIYVLRYENFQCVDSCDPRPLSSVFLPEGQIEHVKAELTRFLAAKQWYVERGIPWRLGFYFHGVAGSGKTSLIKALVGELRLDLYVANLSSRGLDDRGLSYALSSLPPGAVLLFEDIDAAFVAREKNKDNDNTISFSGLLNALDGAASREGWIVFMTTNHPERVDPALTRPGRADIHLEFGYATAEQAAGMFRAFFPDAIQAEAFGELVATQRMTMAAVQQHLIFHQKSPVEALAALPILKEAMAVGAAT
jgi:chaperone BCS1